MHLAHARVTLVGAHEWRLPLRAPGDDGFSIEGNVATLFRLALDAGPLVSHLLPPERAPEAYQRLRARRGVVFD